MFEGLSEGCHFEIWVGDSKSESYLDLLDIRGRPKEVEIHCTSHSFNHAKDDSATRSPHAHMLQGSSLAAPQQGCGSSCQWKHRGSKGWSWLHNDAQGRQRGRLRDSAVATLLYNRFWWDWRNVFVSLSTLCVIAFHIYTSFNHVFEYLIWFSAARDILSV